MNREVDGRGLDCPKPVILTKKELENITEGTVTTIVDNEAAKGNVSRLASSMDLDYTVEESGDNFIIKIVKEEGSMKESAEEVALAPCKTTIAIGSDKMGKGDDELGNVLMKSFIYTVRETQPYPDSIVFYNSAVNLTCEGSEVLDDIKALAESGVEIQSCGTCLDFYEIKDKLAVGIISNMYSIYETMKEANTINIG